jgi:hypothetical protein
VLLDYEKGTGSVLVDSGIKNLFDGFGNAADTYQVIYVGSRL